jgi:hypothetical protein
MLSKHLSKQTNKPLLWMFAGILTFFSATAFSNNQSEEGLIVATGFGATDLSKFPIKSQAKIMAKRAAQVDAQRNLSEQIKGLRLTGGTTMEDFEVSKDIVATRVKALLKGAFELESDSSADDQSVIYEVKMAVCLNNSNPLCKGKDTIEKAAESESTSK